MVRVSDQVFATRAASIPSPISDVTAPAESQVNAVFHLDVIEYVNRITGNLMALTEGNELRSATWVKALLETEMRTCVREGDGLRAEFLQSCLLIATDRLRAAADEAAANRPVPFALTAAGLAAIQDGGH